MARRTTTATPEPPDDSYLADPLDAVPRVRPGVEVAHGDDGNFQVRRPIPPRSRVEQAIARYFGWNRHAEINLDTLGSLFWRQVDGHRDLRAIAKIVQTETNGDEHETRHATLIFTRDLFVRGFIQLEITPASPKGWRP